MGAAQERRTSRRMLSIIATFGLAAGMLATTVSTAGAAACLAKDGIASSSNLQSIIDGASTGDTIVIKGVCIGNFSIPGAGSAMSLTLVGKGTPKATLDGDNAGSVVRVGSLETVTFKNLLITNGNAVDGSGICSGGGIFNDGTIDLKGATQVNGNSAVNYGGGIYNNGTVELSGHAQVNDNSALYGGGFESLRGTNVMLSGEAQVDGNEAYGAGGIDCEGCTLIVTGSAEVNGNAAVRSAGGIESGNALGEDRQVVGAPSPCVATPR
jgi:hypothetical protein